MIACLPICQLDLPCLPAGSASTALLISLPVFVPDFLPACLLSPSCLLLSLSCMTASTSLPFCLIYPACCLIFTACLPYSLMFPACLI
jgi:hypothetical protein